MISKAFKCSYCSYNLDHYDRVCFRRENKEVLIEHQESCMFSLWYQYRILARSLKWWREFNNQLLSINWFRSINKVKGLRMETNVDTRRISLVELQTLVSLGIWSSVHKVWLHDSFLVKHICNWKDQVIAFATTDCGQQNVHAFLTG